MSYNELLRYNPWWTGRQDIENDNEIQKWEKSTLKWIPRIKEKFRQEDLIYTLRGPRQVGKTTLVKLMIRDLLKNGINPWNTLYYSFDVEKNPSDVVEVINVYLDRSKRFRNSNRAFLFLDEISNIPGWQKGIKKLKDQGKLDNCTVIATGSHSIDLRHAEELMPGRRGITDDEPLDKIMPPMKFSEYVFTIDDKIRKEIESKHLLNYQKRMQIFEKLLKGEISDELNSLSVYQKDLDQHFENYLLTGGVPPAINEYLNNGTIRESIYNIYLTSMKGDLNKVYKTENYLPQLMPNIITALGSPTSWSSLKGKTDISHHKTVEDYVRTLASMFVLIFLYQYNAKNDAPHYSGNKKIYFQDVFFFHALNAMLRNEKPFGFSLKFLENPIGKSKLVENIVGDHLIRLAFNFSPAKPTFDYTNSVFYWKGREDREVDFIVRENKNLVPIEVKYQNDIGRDDLQGIIDFKKVSGVKHAIMLTKKDFDVKYEAVFIPIPLFLLLV